MLDYNEFYLYLIRHGQSEVNVLPDMVGQKGDSKLTEKGRNQANLLGERLFRKEKIEPSLVFSSDYTRALDTCEIALGHHPVKIAPSLHPEIREYSAGDWTQSSRSQAYTAPVLMRMAAMNSAFLPPNGESMHMVERRASQWLEDNILYNQKVQEEAELRMIKRKKGEDRQPMNILVFSHGMTIKCLLHYIMGFDQSFTWKLTLENTAISKLYFNSYKEGWRLLTINDHAHLL